MIDFGRDQIRAEAFRHLLRDGVPVAPATIAEAAGVPLAEAVAAIDETEAVGLIRRGEDGLVVGAAGLSVVPSRHRLQIGASQFWTWCAYDALGILAALRADGRVDSVSPLTGAPLSVPFLTCQPAPARTVLFLSAMADCCLVYHGLVPERESVRG